MATRYELTVTYPAERYPEGDQQVLAALGPPPDGRDRGYDSGLGFGGRDLHFAFDSAASADEARARVAKVHGVDAWVDAYEDCDHQWEEQPGEPPVDVCVSCGARRE